MMYHIWNIPIWRLYSAHQICFFSRIAVVKTILAFVWYVGEDKLIRLLVHYVGNGQGQPRTFFDTILPLAREVRADVVFKASKKQIVHGKVYKEECLSDNTYKYFKSGLQKLRARSGAGAYRAPKI